jgi:hypothetical protein
MALGGRFGFHNVVAVTLKKSQELSLFTGADAVFAEGLPRVLHVCVPFLLIDSQASVGAFHIAPDVEAGTSGELAHLVHQ